MNPTNKHLFRPCQTGIYCMKPVRVGVPPRHTGRDIKVVGDVAVDVPAILWTYHDELDDSLRGPSSLRFHRHHSRNPRQMLHVRIRLPCLFRQRIA